MKAIRIIMKGKVQGVNFRAFARQNAGKLGVVGWARNKKDGSLEIIAQGEENKVEQLINLCRKGPILARVESTNKEIIDIDEELEIFDIRF